MNRFLPILFGVSALFAACGALERGAAPPADALDTHTGVLDVAEDDGAEPPGDAGDDASVTGISFADDGVHDALMTNCAGSGCHGGTGGGEYTLTGETSGDYSETLNVISAGDAANSRLLRKASNEISHAGGPVLLPGDDAYDLIAVWINGGANP